MKLKIKNVLWLGMLTAGLNLLTFTAPAQDSTAAPAAAVAKVTREDLFKEITVPAEFRPYEEVELHAKVSGYVQTLNVDFGDAVTNGQLLGTLEVPELGDELTSAQAMEKKAEADDANAHLIYSRLLSVNKAHPNLVAQQELDTAQANDLTAAAAIAAAQASVKKFETLVSYTQITAPFAGVVTHRYVDPGTLIQASMASDTQTLPLVRVSDDYRLRLDFPVTVDYVQDIQVGAPVLVRVDSLGGKMLQGKISRFTHDVNDDTRTMETEIEVPNADLKLMPGMYASVILKVAQHPDALAIPVEAIADDTKPTVFVLNRDNQIEERAVKLGMETPDKYEVLSGLAAGDVVIVGDRTQFQPGETVTPQLTNNVADSEK